MVIRFDCGSCGVTLRVGDDKAGKRGKCPKCGNVISVPMAATAAAVSAPVPQIRPAPPGGSSTGAQGVDGRRVRADMQQQGREARPRSSSLSTASAVVTGGQRCPSCRGDLPSNAKLCVRCGIKVKSGRPILTARTPDEDQVEIKSERILRWLSWVVPMGLYPFYSEAGGRAKPYTTWAIAGLTVVVSLWFLVAAGSGSDQGTWMMANLVLWRKVDPAERLPAWEELSDPQRTEEMRRLKTEYGEDLSEDDAGVLYEHGWQSKLPPGEHAFHQLLTCTLLHSGILHLAGNMLFLFVFGTRVNAVIGNIGMLVLYVLLAIISGLVEMPALSAGTAQGSLGASGAVMGLAGFYLLLFPLHKVHMVFWIRWGLIALFRLTRKVFAAWGFVVVLFYIAFDVLFVALGWETGVAHWAHLGGFLGGLALAAILLMTRLAHTGGDALSLILGRFAWPLIGTPRSHVGRKPMLGLW